MHLSDQGRSRNGERLMRPFHCDDVHNVLAWNQVKEHEVPGDHSIVAVATQRIRFTGEWIVTQPSKGREDEISVASRKPCDGDLEVIWHVDAPHTLRLP